MSKLRHWNVQKQCSETTRCRLCCEKLVHFWSVLLLKEQMMTSVRKMLKMLVRSAQNRLISSKICPENNHKIRRYLPIAFRPSFPLKIPAKTADFSAILSPKNPAKFDFFPQSIRSPINVKASVSNHQTSPTQTSLKCCDLVVKYLNQQRQWILTKSSMSKVEKTMEESICSFPALVYLNLTTLPTVKAYMYLSIYKFPQITFKVIFYIDIYLAINMHIFGFRTMNLVKTIPCYNYKYIYSIFKNFWSFSCDF